MPLTILVTGATAGFGAAMARRFVRDGHRVIAAARRADRLAALHKPDIIILDLGLPDVNGVEVIKTVRSWSTRLRY